MGYIVFMAHMNQMIRDIAGATGLSVGQVIDKFRGAEHARTDCLEAAKTIQLSMPMKQRRQSTIIILFPDPLPAPGDNTIQIMSLTKGGKNGKGVGAFHAGLHFEGIVFCTVWPGGKLRQEWLNDFVSKTGKIRQEEFAWNQIIPNY
jgi:hypothetical protein